jgi:HEAT repeat protein
VRVATVQALAAIGPGDAMAALEEAVGDPDESVRLAAVDALAGGGVEAARLMPVTRDPSQKVRRRLAAACGRLPGADAVIDALAEDLAPAVRAAALVTLLDLGDEARLARFHEVWARQAEETRAAARADERVAARAAELAALLGSSSLAGLRRLAVGCIAALALEGHERLLVGALADPAPSVRLAAVRALAGSRDETVTARVLELVDDPDGDVRETARKSRLRAV